MRFVSITRAQSASSVSSVAALCVIPAALTRMSTLPNFSSTASCSDCSEARSCTSLVTASERHPMASISAATFLTCSRRRELGTTSAPAPASPCAIACPNPVVPPVTTATRPCKSKRFWLIGSIPCWLSHTPTGRFHIRRCRMSRTPQKTLPRKAIYFPARPSVTDSSLCATVSVNANNLWTLF